MTRSHPVLAALLALSLAACRAEGVYTDHSELEAAALSAFLSAETTREELLLALGLPAAQFEGERILCWRMVLSGEGVLRPVGPELDGDDPRMRAWGPAEFSLVLVFDDAGRVAKHSLVKVK